MTDKPNILVIMSDEHNAKMMGGVNHPLLDTPNLDRLAAEGMLFNNCYCSSPLCVPSRTSFMNGRTASDNHVLSNSCILNSGMPTWAHSLNKAGYHTALIGRMHFDGPDQNHGFSYVHPDLKNWKDNSPVTTQIPTEKVPAYCYESSRRSIENSGSGTTHVQYRDERVTDAAQKFLKEMAMNPESLFACVVGFYMPHPPYVAKTNLFDKYFDKVNISYEENILPDYLKQHFNTLYGVYDDPPLDENCQRAAIAAYLALCEHTDILVGKILDTLDETGLAKNTLVIYTSDHGDMAGKAGLWGKSQFYDDSVLVPFIARWPGVIPGDAICDNICELRSIGSTFCEITGAETTSDAPSLLPLFKGKSENWKNRAESEIFFCSHLTKPELTGVEWCACKMIRQDNWKLWCWYASNNVYYSLFNMAEDPEELNDLIDNPSNQEIITKLKDILRNNWNPERIAPEVAQRFNDWNFIRKDLAGRSIQETLGAPDDLENDIEIVAPKKNHL